MADKLDIYGTKPLHHLNRFSLIVELRQVRAELIDAKQKIKDLEGEIAALIECENYKPANDVRKTGRNRT